MKKLSLSLFVMAFAAAAIAQETGMRFEHNTSWEKVLAKAKAENKYIFVDCFATWCGPCKQMAKNIFPQEEVGKFFNANFINLKIQFDTTAADDAEVKSWFATAAKINKEYKIAAYPTYMMFDPNGVAVHRAVGSSQAEQFIAKGKDALNPEKQYYTLKRKYEAGNRDEKFMYQTVLAAVDAYDKEFAKKISDDYLSTQTDLYTKENLTLLRQFTQTSKDQGFKIMSQNPEKVDAVLGKGEANKVVKNIVLREEVMPIAFGKNVTTPDWAGLETTLKTKYPAQANEILLYSKVLYTQQKRDWKNFGTAVSEYMKSFGSNATPEQMNQFAWTVFENCDDMACVTNALDWSKQSFAQNNSPMFMDTYANLLYKAGKKKEAIEWETKAMTLAKANKEDAGEYQATIDKMTKGEKTW
jgi:thiol-disulfide isomerase/thioredoxin